MKEIGSAKVSYGSNAVNGPEHPVTGTSGDTESCLSELEPCAVKVARTVLRGGRSGQPASPTRLRFGRDAERCSKEGVENRQSRVYPMF